MQSVANEAEDRDAAIGKSSSAMRSSTSLASSHSLGYMASNFPSDDVCSAEQEVRHEPLGVLTPSMGQFDASVSATSQPHHRSDPVSTVRSENRRAKRARQREEKKAENEACGKASIPQKLRKKLKRARMGIQVSPLIQGLAWGTAIAVETNTYHREVPHAATGWRGVSSDLRASQLDNSASIEAVANDVHGMPDDYPALHPDCDPEVVTYVKEKGWKYVANIEGWVMRSAACYFLNPNS